MIQLDRLRYNIISITTLTLQKEDTRKDISALYLHPVPRLSIQNSTSKLEYGKHSGYTGDKVINVEKLGHTFRPGKNI